MLFSTKWNSYSIAIQIFKIFNEWCQNLLIPYFTMSCAQHGECVYMVATGGKRNLPSIPSVQQLSLWEVLYLFCSTIPRALSQLIPALASFAITSSCLHKDLQPVFMSEMATWEIWWPSLSWSRNLAAVTVCKYLCESAFWTTVESPVKY